MEKREENIRRLKQSLEVKQIRDNMLLYSVVMPIGGGLVWLRGMDTPGSGLYGIVIFALFWAVIMGIYGIWLFRIFRRAEDYCFCKGTLTKLHRGMVKHSMGFTVVLEIPGEGKVVAKTRAIFLTHGWPGPLVEDYVNQEVEIAYNRTTRQTVVIG